ncbi:hypothetical protein ACKWTF_000057 [Chironomus riparius]
MNIERASFFDMSLFLTVTLISMIIFAMSDYLKSVVLAFRVPGPKAYPIIGNTNFAIEGDVFQNRGVPLSRICPGLLRLWFFIFPFFAVYEPEYLQKILGSKGNTEKSFFYKFLHNFLGKGLITNSGTKWSSHRRYIQPAFRNSILEKFVKTFADSAQSLQEKIMRGPDVLNITQFVNDCVLDVLNEAVLGVPILERATKGKNEESPWRQGKVVVQNRVARPWLMFSWIYNWTKTSSDEIEQKGRLNAFTREMIRKRREESENGAVKERVSLLEYMIDINKRHPDFTDEDIIDETCTFMLAGQDSVGASLAFTMYLIAQHPEHQQKCIDEIDEIFGSDNRSPTMNDLYDMKYLEMCIKEALRLYPAVPIMARKLGEEVRCGKYLLPVGAEVFILPYITHRLEHIFLDAEKFVPERFTPENVEKRNPYAFLPFSAGPRNCIGHKFAIIEMKTIISRILRSFTMHTVPGKSFEPLFRITLRAKGGLYVRFEPRNNNNNNDEKVQ